MRTCKTCNSPVNRRGHYCSRCRWAKVAEAMKGKRNTPAHRAKQIAYHSRCREEAEKHLKKTFGDGQAFVCQGCQFSSTVKRQFSLHHLDPDTKTGRFAHFTRRGSFLKKLGQEAATLICENCHRLEKPKGKSYAKHSTRKKLILEQLGKSLRCEDCGFESEHTQQFDFHHLNPFSKSAGGMARAVRNRPLQALEEARECRLLCARCHQLSHAKAAGLKEPG